MSGYGPQGQNSPYNDRVRARYIEHYLREKANTNRPLKFDLIQELVSIEFPDDKLLKDHPPNERTVRDWVKKDRDLPDRLKKLGLLKEWKPPQS